MPYIEALQLLKSQTKWLVKSLETVKYDSVNFAEKLFYDVGFFGTLHPFCKGHAFTMWEKLLIAKRWSFLHTLPENLQ